MRVTSKNDLCPVVIDIDGDKRQLFEDIADIVLRKILEEDEMESTHAIPAQSAALTPAATGVNASPLSIAQLLGTSVSSQQSAAFQSITSLTPFQLALYSALLTSQINYLFPNFGGPSQFLPLFVPPPQPQPQEEEEEPTDFLKMMSDILSKQQRR